MKTTFTMLFTCLLGLAATHAYAQIGPDQIPDDLEAKAYARMNHVTLQEAKRRQAIWTESDRQEIVVKLREKYKDRLAGIYQTDHPELSLTVRLKGPQPVKDEIVVTQHGSLPIKFIVGASATLQELLDAITPQNLEIVKKALPEAQGISPDEMTGDIVLTIHAQPQEESAFSEYIPMLSKLFGHPVRLEFIPVELKPAALGYGGAPLTAFDGTFLSDCTTGFGVQSKTTGTKGLLTAAHCANNNQTYSNYYPPGSSGYVAFPIYFVDEMYDGSRDIQWHMLGPGNIAAGSFFASSDTSARAVFGRLSKASLKLGKHFANEDLKADIVADKSNLLLIPH